MIIRICVCTHSQLEKDRDYPSNLRASTVQSTWLTFSWDRIERHSKLGFVTGYQIQFSHRKGSEFRVIRGPEFTAYTFMELKPCTYYRLRVAANFNGSTICIWSPAVGVTTPPDGKDACTT